MRSGNRSGWTSHLLPLFIFLSCQTSLQATRHRSIRHAVATPAQSIRSPTIEGTLKGLQVNASGGKAGNMRVVVVNDISGHLEVLGCLLHMLRDAGVQPTTLYTGPQQLLHALGFFQWLGYTPEETAPSPASRLLAERKGSFGYDVPGLGHFHNLPGASRIRMPKGLSADLVICITPELARGECSSIVAALKPAYLVTWVHRGDMISSQVYSMYPRQALVALSPHVAEACEQATGVPVDWALPIAPHIDPVEECRNITCLSGFVMQGAIRSVSVHALGKGGHTRDYRTLWSRLMKLQRISRTAADPKGKPPVHVTVLGRGNARHLEVPRQLANYVNHSSGLPYPEFWSKIHHSLALLPCFGTEDYYTVRLSSTITASIITGTPLIADRRLLNTYTFLTEEHVFMQLEGEDEAAAMVRIANMSEAEVFSRRNALVRLRETLNNRSQMVLSKWLAVTKALSTPDQSGRGRSAGFMLPPANVAEVQAKRAARRVAFRAARRHTHALQQQYQLQRQQGTGADLTLEETGTAIAQQEIADRH